MTGSISPWNTTERHCTGADSPVGGEKAHIQDFSGIVDGNRYLSAIFDAKSHLVHDRPFAWEDWKQEIIFITVLYGGFEDKEEVYHALSKLEVPDDDNVLKWGVPLSNGYCGVQRSRISQSPAFKDTGG